MGGETEREVTTRAMGFGRAALVFVSAMGLLLVCLRLDGVFTNWLEIFWPIFLVAAVFFCCCCCLCCAVGLMQHEARDVPPLDPSSEAGTPGSTSRSGEEARAGTGEDVEGGLSGHQSHKEGRGEYSPLLRPGCPAATAYNTTARNLESCAGADGGMGHNANY